MIPWLPVFLLAMAPNQPPHAFQYPDPGRPAFTLFDSTYEACRLIYFVQFSPDETIEMWIGDPTDEWFASRWLK